MNTYKKTNWQDSPSTDTPLDAEHLNNIEDGIEAATNAVITLETSKVDKVDTYTKTETDKVIEAVTESVTALETSKANRVDTYTKVETDNQLSSKENASNKVNDIDTACTDEQYPTANAVKQFLNYNYYDCTDTEDKFQFKLEAGDNVKISSAGTQTSNQLISVDLSGVKGEKGDAGTTPLMRKSNTAIQVSYDNGSTYTDLVQLSDLGVGEKGDDGYTPVKGVDYFTTSDVNEIVNAVYAKVVDGTEVSY